MSTFETDDTTAKILEHADWVRALAGRLVGNRTEADDLAQETLVTALDRSPDRVGSWRAWLSAVLTNCLRQGKRAARRRSVREQECARSDSSGPTLDVVSRLQTHRRVVDAVERLAEPYRSAIWLRYYDDLPPRDIATRLDVSVKTVDSWLHRARRMLRDRLRRDLGGGDQWAVALLSLAAAKPTAAGVSIASWTTLGATVMGTKLKLISACVIAVIGATLFWPEPTEAETEPPTTAGDPNTHRGSAGGGRGGTGGGASGRRTERSRVDTPNTARTRDARALREVNGLVLDSDGLPVAHVPLEFSPRAGEAVAVTSGPGGRFEASIPDTVGDFRTAGPSGYVTVMEGTVKPNSNVPPIVVVARPIDLGGHIVNADGRGIEGVALIGLPPDDFGARFDQLLEGSALNLARTKSRTDGTFRLPGLPAITGASIEIRHPMYETTRIPIPQESDESMWIELARPESTTNQFLGRVVLPNGVPAAGARVGMGMATVVTDERGEFRIDRYRVAVDDRIVAIHPGYLPAKLARAEGSRPWPDYIELRLAGTALSIRGRILDAEGQPREGVDVWIADPTLLGVVHGLPVQVENVSAGARIAGASRSGSASNFLRADLGTSDLTLPQDAPTACWSWVTTDEHGAFTLEGLDDRSYRIRILDRETLQSVTSNTIQAGSAGIEITLPDDGMIDEVRGRVLSLGGAPLAGIELQLLRKSFESILRRPGSKFDFGMFSQGARTRSDDEGRFTLRRVPEEGVFVSMNGDSILEHAHHVGPEARDSEIEIRVPARCHLRVENAADADAVRVLDAEGQPLDVIVQSGHGINAYLHMRVSDGRTGVFSVSERAQTLVFLREGEEVARKPLALRAGDTTVVQR